MVFLLKKWRNWTVTGLRVRNITPSAFRCVDLKVRIECLRGKVPVDKSMEPQNLRAVDLKVTDTYLEVINIEMIIEDMEVQEILEGLGIK